MGHSTVRAAMIYQHATRERDREIAEAMSREVAGWSGSEHGVDTKGTEFSVRGSVAVLRRLARPTEAAEATRHAAGTLPNPADRPSSTGRGSSVLVDRAPVHTHVVPSDRQDAGVKVDVRPAQREELSAAHAGHHHQPDQRAPVIVLRPRSVDDPGGLRHCRRLGLRRRRAWLSRNDRRVRGDPSPANSCSEHAADREVDATHRRASQRLALVLPALDDPAALLRAVVRWIAGRGRSTWRALVLHRPALMRAVGAVLHEWAPLAPRTAPAQVGVELLQHFSGHPTDGNVAERGV
jgi:hypothetical protein